VAATAAADGALVLLSGDFNARVGSLSDNVPMPGSSNGGQRGCTDQTTNAHGKALIKFCQRTGLALCTGCIREASQPSSGDHAAVTARPPAGDARGV